jgi:hypothetical protein
MIGGIVLDEDCALVAIVLREQLEEGLPEFKTEGEDYVAKVQFHLQPP